MIQAAETVVNFGLLASVAGQYPEHVQEGMIERMKMLAQRLDQETEIIRNFGEAYDG